MNRPTPAPRPTDDPRWTGMLPRLRRYARVLAVQADAADDLVARALAQVRHTRSVAASPVPLMAIVRRLHHADRAPGDRERAHPRPSEAHDDPGTHGAGVLARLWQLPTDEREVLLLVAVERLAYDDVAGLLGVPAATVIARLTSARANLRALMDPSDAG